MTISVKYAPNTYSGNGATTSFAITFPFLSTSGNIKVSSKLNSTGIITTLVNPTDYSVSGSNVLMVVAPASGTTLIIELTTDFLQSTDYVEYDPFPANTNETALDKLTLETNLVDEKANRAIKIDPAITSTITNTTISGTPTANAVIAVNATNNGLAYTAAASVGVVVLPATLGLFAQTTAGVLTARSIAGTANEITLTNGTGVSGNPTVSLPTALTFTGKTITGGTFASPTLTTPALGTPASGVLTNCTGTAASLTAGTVTTNANLTGHVTSVGNAAVLGSFTSAQLATALTDETGSGAAVFGTSPTITTPKIAQINDTNGVGNLIFTTAASAVNQVTLANSATGVAPTFSASGTDSNIGIGLQIKGTGNIHLLGTSTSASNVKMYEQTTNGTNTMTISAPASLTSDRTFTWPDSSISSIIIQRVSTESGAVATGTTIVPSDDTIPQNTEGTQFQTLSITPQNSSNILVIDVIHYYGSSAAQNMGMALFQDSTANALAAQGVYLAGTGYIMPVTLRHIMTAGTTSATTFKIRTGPGSAATITFNGVSGGRIYGGVIASTMMITEYSA